MPLSKDEALQAIGSALLHRDHAVVGVLRAGSAGGVEAVAQVGAGPALLAVPP